MPGRFQNGNRLLPSILDCRTCRPRDISLSSRVSNEVHELSYQGSLESELSLDLRMVPVAWPRRNCRKGNKVISFYLTTTTVYDKAMIKSTEATVTRWIPYI